MKFRKWQIPVLGLLLLLLLQSVISLWVYDVQIKQLRRSVKWGILNALPNDELTLVKVATHLEKRPNAAFYRKHEKEFQFLGEWYDIVRSNRMGDTTYYYCFHDKKETTLYRKIQKAGAQLTHTDSNTQSRKSLAIFDLFKQHYLKPEAKIHLFQKLVIHKLYYTDDLLQSLKLSCTSPPPEHIA